MPTMVTFGGFEQLVRFNLLEQYRQLTGTDLIEAIQKLKGSLPVAEQNGTLKNFQDQCDQIQRNVKMIKVSLSIDQSGTELALKNRKKAFLLNEYISVILISKEDRCRLDSARLRCLENARVQAKQYFVELQNILNLYSFLYGKQKIDVLQDDEMDYKQIKRALTSFRKLMGIGQKRTKQSKAYNVSSFLKDTFKEVLHLYFRKDCGNKISKRMITKSKQKWFGPKLWKFVDQFKIPIGTKRRIIERLIAETYLKRGLLDFDQSTLEYLDQTINKIKLTVVGIPDPEIQQTQRQVKVQEPPPIQEQRNYVQVGSQQNYQYLIMQVPLFYYE